MRRRFILPAAVLLAAAALLALLGFGVSQQGTNSSIDAQVAARRYPPAPNSQTALPVLGGPGRRSLASLRGQVVVLNVFASWCEPCRYEAPVLEQAQDGILHGHGTILGVTYLDNSSDSERFVRVHHLTFPVVRDVDGNLVHALGVTGVPETFVIDRDGRIAALNRGPLAASWLQRTLPPIIDGQP